MSRRPTRDHHFRLRGRDVPPVSPEVGTSRGRERLRREREKFVILQRRSSSSSDENILEESPKKKKKVFIPQKEVKMAAEGIGLQIQQFGQILQHNNTEVVRQNEQFREARNEAVDQLQQLAERMEALRGDIELPPAQPPREERDEEAVRPGRLRNNNALLGRLLPEKYAGTEGEDPKDFVSACTTAAKQFYGQANINNFCEIFPSLLKKAARHWYDSNQMEEVHDWDRMKEMFLQRFDSLTDSEKNGDEN